MKKKRKNPINLMDLSEEDSDIWDNFINKIDKKIKSEKEMKYKNNTLIFILQNLKTQFASDNDSIYDASESLNDIISTLKELEKILN